MQKQNTEKQNNNKKIKQQLKSRINLAHSSISSNLSLLSLINVPE
jgi:hypothetical protein